MYSVIVYMSLVWSAAPEIAVFDVRGRNNQRVANPLSGREAGPTVRRICRRMRAAIQVNRTVQRSPELNVVGLKLTRNRIDFFHDSQTTSATPLVRD
jgi:hypothetical protein